MRRTVAAALLSGLALCACSKLRVEVAGTAAGPAAISEPKVISFELEQSLLPSLRPSAERGADVYRRVLDGGRSCVSCHGADGRPAAPGAPDFSTAEWLRDSYPNDLREHIIGGQAGGADRRHPPAPHDYGRSLSLQEQWDVLAWCRYLSSGGAEALRATQNDLFGRNCSVCHGNRGYGNGFLAPTMEPAPRDLSDYAAWGMQRTDREIFDNIANGVHWSAMPPWRGTLEPEEIWSVVDFIRSLQYDVPESGDQAGGGEGGQ